MDRMVKAIIGMSREKFESLVPYFSSAYQTIREGFYRNKKLNHYQMKLVGWATKVARQTKPPAEDNTPEGGGLYLRSALRRTEIFFGLSTLSR